MSSGDFDADRIRVDAYWRRLRERTQEPIDLDAPVAAKLRAALAELDAAAHQGGTAPFVEAAIAVIPWARAMLAECSGQARTQ